ncbi:hypothetical protein [Cellulomonas taurus]|nr:hypothetical protein [Cellulomonas taurus]
MTASAPRIVRQPDGTVIGKRPSSKSGGPVVDIRYPDGRVTRIRVEGAKP